jgi:CRP-like cAMP-binding protein
VRLIKVDAEFQFEVLKYLAEEWKDIENHVHSLGTKQIHSRLAELLITFYNASNKDKDLTIHITRDAMATCIGSTKESLIRALGDFKNRNWIRLDKNKIELLNLKLLYSLAEIEYL